MSGYRDCQSTEIAAPPEDCYAALTDFEHLPDWQGAVRRAEVLERDAQGRGLVVEYEVDAKVRTVRYTLRQIHEPPQRLGCEYLSGDFRDFSGEWRFVALEGGRTRAELELRIDPGRFVPGPLRGAISDAVMRRALRDLKRHLERQRTPSSTSTTS
jgi:ribosome-associated toxin RatA of RatAB toxin-antitoxin module